MSVLYRGQLLISKFVETWLHWIRAYVFTEYFLRPLQWTCRVLCCTRIAPHPRHVSGRVRKYWIVIHLYAIFIHIYKLRVYYLFGFHCQKRWISYSKIARKNCIFPAILSVGLCCQSTFCVKQWFLINYKVSFIIYFRAENPRENAYWKIRIGYQNINWRESWDPAFPIRDNTRLVHIFFLTFSTWSTVFNDVYTTILLLFFLYFSIIIV